MDAAFISALAAVCMIFIILFAALIAKFFAQSKEISELKTHVAENYATKDESKAHAERLERQMEVGFNRLYDALKNREKVA